MSKFCLIILIFYSLNVYCFIPSCNENEIRGISKIVRDCNWTISNSFKSDFTTKGQLFLSEHHEILGMKQDLSDINFVHVKKGLVSIVETYQQHYDGYPVYNAQSHIHLVSVKNFSL